MRTIGGLILAGTTIKADQATEKAAVNVEDAKESMDEKAAQAGENMDDSAMTSKIKMEIHNQPMLKVF